MTQATESLRRGAHAARLLARSTFAHARRWARSSARALWKAVWPFRPEAPEGRSWALGCTLTVFPVTAILHHAVFYPSQCILNPFGPDYDLVTITRLLLRDPSLPWAIAVCLFLWILGSKRRWVRKMAAPVFFAFLPLTLYLWDIPFSGRVICRSLHDAQPVLGDFSMRTGYFYAWGAAAYLAILVYLLSVSRIGSGGFRPESGR